MSDTYNFDEEFGDIKAKLENAKAMLLAAAEEITSLLEDEHADIDEVSNDAFTAIVAMLAGIKEDYDIMQLAEDALNAE